MGCTPSKALLAVVAVPVAFLLGAAPAFANGGTCPPSTLTFHLHAANNNLTLEQTAPPAGPANFVDSPALSRAAGNPWRQIGEWEGYTGGTSCLIFGISPVHVWLGLRNSDDQGTNFDLKAEVWAQPQPPGPPAVLLTSAEVDCIKGLTRNPALAREILVGTAHTIAPPLLDNVELSLVLYARIGSPTSCGGHSSATGLRVYFDSQQLDSFFQLLLGGPG